MHTAFEDVYTSVQNWEMEHGIQVQEKQLPAGQAGEFNGLSVTMNSAYEMEERVYYLIHALGSIVLWSQNKQSVQGMFDRLRSAKKEKQLAPQKLELAIDRYCEFERESSELAVGLLLELGFREMEDPYTNFMKADLQAMCEFHRTGVAPVWRKFFATWNEQVATGCKGVLAFQPQSMPRFSPVKIRRQEILQEQGERS